MCYNVLNVPQNYCKSSYRKERKYKKVLDNKPDNELSLPFIYKE